jgi:hypothetical protein
MRLRSLKVPAQLQPSVDALVKATQSRRKNGLGRDFQLVTSWCEEHEDEAGIQTGEFGKGFLVVWLGSELPGCADADVDLPMEVPVTDDVRVSHIRDRLREIFEGTADDSETLPMACTIRIQSRDGETACLGYLLSGGGGMGGLAVHWEGVYRDLKHFRTDLRRREALTSFADARRVDNEGLLKLWRREDRQSSETFLLAYQHTRQAPEDFVTLLRERGEGGVGFAGIIHPLEDTKFDPYRLEDKGLSEGRLDALFSGEPPTKEELALWRNAVRDQVFQEGEGNWNIALLWRVTAVDQVTLYGVVLQGDKGSWDDVLGPFLTPETALQDLRSRGEVFDVNWA